MDELEAELQKKEDAELFSHFRSNGGEWDYGWCLENCSKNGSTIGCRNKQVSQCPALPIFFEGDIMGIPKQWNKKAVDNKPDGAHFG